LLLVVVVPEEVLVLEVVVEVLAQFVTELHQFPPHKLSQFK
jgi:hypothetical protein